MLEKVSVLFRFLNVLCFIHRRFVTQLYYFFALRVHNFINTCNTYAQNPVFIDRFKDFTSILL